MQKLAGGAGFCHYRLTQAKNPEGIRDDSWMHFVSDSHRKRATTLAALYINGQIAVHP
jgi:hypothetical protein